MFVLRAFIYACAFAGAGWFGLWLSDIDKWDSGFTWIIVSSVIAGLLAALVLGRRERRSRSSEKATERPW